MTHSLEMKRHWTLNSPSFRLSASLSLCLSLSLSVSVSVSVSLPSLSPPLPLRITKPPTDVFKSLTFEDCFGLLPLCVLLGLMRVVASQVLLLRRKAASLPMNLLVLSQPEHRGPARPCANRYTHTHLLHPSSSSPSDLGWPWFGAFLLVFVTVGISSPLCALA